MSITWDTGVTMTVEAAFGDAPYDTPSWTDISDYLEGIQINRGTAPTTIPQAIAATCTVMLKNDDARFDPGNTSSPYGLNKVIVGVPIRISATYSAATYRLFYGFATGWDVDYPDMGLRSVTVLSAVDGIQRLNQEGIGANTYPVESTSSRLAAVLDDVGWPAGLRNLDTGVTDVEAFDDDTTVTAFRHINDVVNIEAGRVFIAGDGDFTFHNRTHHAGGASSLYTFGPSDLPYSEVTVAYNDEFLYNTVEVTSADGTVARAEHITSIEDYGARVLAYSGVAATFNDATNVAEWQRSRFGVQRVRVSSFELKPQADPTNLWPAVLGLDLRDVVTVKTDPPGSGTNLTQKVAVDGISHTITHEEWVTVYDCFALAAHEIVDFWILGTSELGIDTRLA